MKKTKYLICTIVLALAISVFLPCFASASTQTHSGAFCGKDDDLTVNPIGNVSDVDASVLSVSLISEQMQEPDEEVGGKDNAPYRNEQSADDKTPDNDAFFPTEDNASDNEEQPSAEDKNDTHENTEEQGAEPNIFSDLYQSVIGHFDDILSLLTFVLGIIITLLYKKQLIPGISGGARSIKESLEALKEDAEKERDEYGEEIGSLREDISALSRSVAELTDGLMCVKEYVCDEGRIDEAKKSRSVLLTQIDMLYNIFITSALPEYQKEKIGKQVLEMKKELDENE